MTIKSPFRTLLAVTNVSFQDFAYFIQLEGFLLDFCNNSTGFTQERNSIGAHLVLVGNWHSMSQELAMFIPDFSNDRYCKMSSVQGNFRPLVRPDDFCTSTHSLLILDGIEMISTL